MTSPAFAAAGWGSSPGGPSSFLEDSGQSWSQPLQQKSQQECLWLSVKGMKCHGLGIAAEGGHAGGACGVILVGVGSPGGKLPQEWLQADRG